MQPLIVIARVQLQRRHGIQSGAARGREGVNRDSRSGIRIAYLARSFVTVAESRTKSRGSGILLAPCQKAGRGERRPLFIMSLPRGDKLG